MHLAKQLILHIYGEIFPHTALKLVNCINMDRKFGRTKCVSSRVELAHRKDRKPQLAHTKS